METHLEATPIKLQTFPQVSIEKIKKGAHF